MFESMAKIARAVDASFMVTTTTSLPSATAAPPFCRVLLGRQVARRSSRAGTKSSGPRGGGSRSTPSPRPRSRSGQVGEENGRLGRPRQLGHQDRLPLPLLWQCFQSEKARTWRPARRRITRGSSVRGRARRNVIAVAWLDGLPPDSRGRCRGAWQVRCRRVANDDIAALALREMW